ncbi:MAG: hypothetical protein GY814_05240 [Gammaproteobacteria bacterium]|nr:hypothetical protein [Gammaproteobacteria bacterium]
MSELHSQKTPNKAGNMTTLYDSHQEDGLPADSFSLYASPVRSNADFYN